jgi:hypothetical protein
LKVEKGLLRWSAQALEWQAHSWQRSMLLLVPFRA